MTFAKASTLSLGMAGMFALGALTGSYVTRTAGDETVTPVVQLEQPVAPVETLQPSREARVVAPRKTSTGLTADVTPATPSVRQHAKSLLNTGTNVEIAAEGFQDAESFVTIAHAARNTAIPFVLLKHRVLTEGQTLSDAIRVSKPELDEVSEMMRARREARTALARMSN
jgi:hypothetical protein